MSTENESAMSFNNAVDADDNLASPCASAAATLDEPSKGASDRDFFDDRSKGTLQSFASIAGNAPPASRSWIQEGSAEKGKVFKITNEADLLGHQATFDCKSQLKGHHHITPALALHKPVNRPTKPLYPRNAEIRLHQFVSRNEVNAKVHMISLTATAPFNVTNTPVATANTSTRRQQAQSPFFRFPVEVRNMIYRQVFQYTLTVNLETKDACQPALTRVNREIRAESLALFYQCTFFYVQIFMGKAYDSVLFKWAQSIGRANLAIMNAKVAGVLIRFCPSKEKIECSNITELEYRRDLAERIIDCGLLPQAIIVNGPAWSFVRDEWGIPLILIDSNGRHMIEGEWELMQRMLHKVQRNEGLLIPCAFAYQMSAMVPDRPHQLRGIAKAHEIEFDQLYKAQTQAVRVVEKLRAGSSPAHLRHHKLLNTVLTALKEATRDLQDKFKNCCKHQFHDFDIPNLDVMLRRDECRTEALRYAAASWAHVKVTEELRNEKAMLKEEILPAAVLAQRLGQKRIELVWNAVRTFPQIISTMEAHNRRYEQMIGLMIGRHFELRELGCEALTVDAHWINSATRIAVQKFVLREQRTFRLCSESNNKRIGVFLLKDSKDRGSQE